MGVAIPHRRSCHSRRTAIVPLSYQRTGSDGTTKGFEVGAGLEADELVGTQTLYSHLEILMEKMVPSNLTTPEAR